MPIVEWSQDFSMGVRRFDEHHQKLFSLLNRTYDMFVLEEPRQHLKTVLDELIDYAAYHFAAEEFWMKEIGYPKFSEHAREHAGYSQRVAVFQAGYDRCDVALTLEVLQFLHGWLVDHILKIDSEYGAFIVARGKRGTLNIT